MVLEIVVSSAWSQEEAEAIALRVATSPLVKTAAFGRDPNWGGCWPAGSAPSNGGFARLDPDRLRVAFDGTPVFAAGAPTGSVPSWRAHPAGSSSTSGSVTARPRTWHPTSRTTTSSSTRSTRRDGHVKLGGRVAAGIVRAALAEVDGGDVVVVHGAGPQITAEMERRGSSPTFVDGRRVTTPDVLDVVRESLAAVNAEVCEAIGPSAVGLHGDEIGLRARRAEALGLVGDRSHRPPGRARRARAGARCRSSPRSPRAASNVNADEAAAALAVGIAAERILS